MKNINELTAASELTDEQIERLHKVIFTEDPEVIGARRLASDWYAATGKMLTIESIIAAVEVAQELLAADFKAWDDGMQDDEKTDLAEMMCGLEVARDLIADMFGLPTHGRFEKVEEDNAEED